MIGIELVKDRKSKEPASDETKEIVRRCYENGLIIISCGVYHNVIRILVPLVIANDQIERAVKVFEGALS